MKEKMGLLINVGSSSKGNSFFIELNMKDTDKPFGLLLDCGFRYEKIASSLREYGKSMNDVSAILVTHRHNDHSHGVKDMVDRGKQVYAPLTVFEHAGLQVDSKYVLSGLKRKSINDSIEVLPIPLDHQEQDGTYVENYGYIVDLDKDFRLMYITDTKFIKYNLRPYVADVIIIEANFDIVMMKYTIESAKGFEKHHFQRVLNSHMSVQHTAKWLSNMDLSKTKLIVLMHLSSNHKTVNTFKFRTIIEDKLKSTGKKHIPKIIVAKMNGGFQ